MTDVDIETDFRAQLAELVPLVLHPKNLVVKRIGGNEVKAKELLHYFKAYTAIYKGNELPEPKSMLEATAEANNLSAVANAKDLYSSSMEEICGGNKPFMSTARIEAEHDRVKGKAMELFGSRRKMGGDDFSTRYRDTLLKVHARISTSCIHQSSIIQSTIDILLMDEIKLSTHSFSLFFSGN